MEDSNTKRCVNRSNLSTKFLKFISNKRTVYYLTIEMQTQRLQHLFLRLGSDWVP